MSLSRTLIGLSDEEIAELKERLKDDPGVTFEMDIFSGTIEITATDAQALGHLNDAIQETVAPDATAEEKKRITDQISDMKEGDGIGAASVSFEAVEWLQELLQTVKIDNANAVHFIGKIKDSNSENVQDAKLIASTVDRYVDEWLDFIKPIAAMNEEDLAQETLDLPASESDENAS